MSLLPCVEIETGPAPTAAVVWLHGLGADGHDFEPIVPALAWPGQPAIRYVFPHAPRRAVTINGGTVMPAWYDIRGLDLKARVDAEGIEDSGQAVADLVAREQSRGVAPASIVIAGFSQGGAVALFHALRAPEAYAGIVALSTYLPLAERLADERSTANAKTPIFMGHGTQDPVVPMALGEASAQTLTSWGYDVGWKTYPMPHAVSPQEIDDLRTFLSQRLRA
ncbi:MAG: dienelactone hydrolase family protein [Pseudomonadota bacterium]